ncbi:MAG TPA: capsule assembly Wzi family protein [Bacteroidales bacterium]|jgi:hypothetical protein|nr:capsule assembly Wzi family protein [Bacteroidales bacterium]
MKKLSHILAIVALCCFAGEVSAQQGNYVLGLEGWGGYTSNGTVPFWLRSNQYGSVPLDGASLSLVGFARKDYVPGKEKLFDWGASFEGRANLGQGSNLTLIEGYGKVRLGIFELRAGRSKKITGLCDTTLSSGSWSISGTSLGIPEVELSVRDFWTIPWFGELFAFKGNFSHGWMGDVQMRRWFDDSDTVLIKTYLHQKSFYGRFGKPSWKVKVFGGFNHQVTWGNESDFYTRDFYLSPIETFGYILTGKRYNSGFIEQTRLGNHIGSLDIGLEYQFTNAEVFIYRQNFYEGGALSKLANIQDGLNGLRLINKKQSESHLKWSKILLEILYTVNQAGEPWSPEYGSLYEGYYNHGEYIEGWSYEGAALGTPFISTVNDVRSGLPAGPEEYFINNRVMAIHLGLEGTIVDVSYILKTSWSENYGTYWTTDEDQSTGLPDPGSYGLFGIQRQVSALLEVNRNIAERINIGLVGAFDSGSLLSNSSALFIKASYKFDY